MKRSSFDESRDQRIANETLDGQARCLICGAMTDRETLSNNGAMCGNCYGVSLSGGNPTVVLTHEEKRAALESMKHAFQPIAGMRLAEAAASRLRVASDGGMRLTEGQRHVLECCERHLERGSALSTGSNPTATTESPALAALELASQARQVQQRGSMDLNDINAALQAEAAE